jgi:anti-sigma B factor antagonist
MVESRRQFEGKARLIPEMRDFVRERCHQVWNQRSDAPWISQLELAVSEAASNIVLHGLRGQSNKFIELVLHVEDDRADVTFLYSGCAFDPQAVPPPDFTGRSECGFGLFLIRQSVDDVVFSRDDAGRCKLRLLKNRKSCSQERSAMDVVTERSADIIVATPIVEHLDLGNSDSVRNDVISSLEDCHKLVLDMGRVKFVDSRGCGAIISCLKHVSADGGDLKLCNVKPEVLSVLELIRLHRICEIVETRKQAIDSFNPPA